MTTHTDDDDDRRVAALLFGTEVEQVDDVDPLPNHVPTEGSNQPPPPTPDDLRTVARDLFATD